MDWFLYQIHIKVPFWRRLRSNNVFYLSSIGTSLDAAMISYVTLSAYVIICFQHCNCDARFRVWGSAVHAGNEEDEQKREEEIGKPCSGAAAYSDVTSASRKEQRKVRFDLTGRPWLFPMHSQFQKWNCVNFAIEIKSLATFHMDCFMYKGDRVLVSTAKHDTE